MNFCSSSEVLKLQELAQNYLKEKKYSQAITLYEKAIALQPEVKSNYWYLGLLFLLDTKEAEAWTTWLWGLSNGTASQEKQWTAQLLQVLETEAQRQQKLGEYRIALAIYQHIWEINPIIKIIIGTSGINQPGWIATDINTLNLLNIENWESNFYPSSIDAILAEHVWEHLNIEQGILAAQNCYLYLKEGAYLRIAVPDGFHPSSDYIEWVKPGGRGPGANEHKILYNYQSLKKLFEEAGFEVDLLEYFDEIGKFHFQEWNPDQGKINRSMRFDNRNKNGYLNYTSIIIDAKKSTYSPTDNFSSSIKVR
ncbi:MAG: tetratricopeptide repeat protein [Cyanobacteriota bacterium]|nr:tetratricopeptide repeat protein [Cyanobacteriota bacterium]